MDIYFCDLCGIRVTDVDLRGGHGIRRQSDVICTTCVELGHGKDWLTQHDCPPPSPARAKTQHAAVLNAPRDRAPTLEEGEENAPPVVPQVVASVAVAEAEGERKVAGKPTEGGGNVNLASAANSFSALGATDRDADAGSSADDLKDEDVAELADDEVEPPSKVPAFAFRGKEEVGRNGKTKPFDDADTVEGRAPGKLDPKAKIDPRKKAEEKKETQLIEKKEKEQTEPGNRLMPRPGRPSSTRTPVAGSARNGGGRSSSKNARAKSGKIRKGGKSDNKMGFIIIGVIAFVFILVVTISVTGRDRPKTGKAEKTEAFRYDTASLRGRISQANVTVDSALRSKSISALKSAREEIQSIGNDMEKFGEAARSHGANVDQQTEDIGWPSLKSKLRNINDEIVKQSQ